MTTTAQTPFRASRYTTGAILLHWLIALCVLGQIAGGWAMTDVFEEGSRLQYNTFQLHKSFGILVLVLTIARIVWRSFNPPPPEPASVARLESRLAGLVHKAFYMLLIAVPLVGWFVVTVARVRIDTELFFAHWLPWPHLPGFAAMAADDRAVLEDGGATVHAFLAWTMGALVLLHVAGALKHHLADGRYVARMWPTRGGDGPRNAYGHASTFLVALAFVAAMVSAAAWARRDAARELPVAGVSPDGSAVLGSAGALEPAAPTELAAAASGAEAPSWQVLPAESAVTFTFGYQGNTRTGAIGTFDAAIRFDPDNLAGSSIAVDLDLSSATIEGTGISAAQVRGPDGLAVATNPRASFESSTLRSTGENAYVADGTLTLRGQSVPVSLPFTLDLGDGRALAKGAATLDRLTFGVGAQSDPTGGTLSPQITVEIAITAQRP